MTYDKTAMTFTVDSLRQNALPYWVSGKISYVDVAPDSLISSVERIYDIRLDPSVRRAINENFSGTLPTDNLTNTMSILSRIYDFQMPYTETDRN